MKTLKRQLRANNKPLKGSLQLFISSERIYSQKVVIFLLEHSSIVVVAAAAAYKNAIIDVHLGTDRK